MARLIGIHPRFVECTAINVQTGVASVSFTGTNITGSTDVIEQVFFTRRRHFCALLRIESVVQSVCYQPPAGWPESTTIAALVLTEPPTAPPPTIAAATEALDNDASASGDISKSEMLILITLGTVALAVSVMAMVYRQRGADAKTGSSGITSYTNAAFEHPPGAYRVDPGSDLAHRIRQQQQQGSLTSSPISIPRIGDPGPLYNGGGLQPMSQGREWQVRGSNPHATTAM